VLFLPEMNITKSSCVIDDPVNDTTSPKRIPGATIRYAVEVKNGGVGPAEDVMVEDNLSSLFNESTIRNLQIQNSVCDCEGVTSASNNGPDGSGDGENPVKLDFDTVDAGTTECGYFEVEVR